jgi:hypothetical protein
VSGITHLLHGAAMFHALEKEGKGVRVDKRGDQVPPGQPCELWLKYDLHWVLHEVTVCGSQRLLDTLLRCFLLYIWLSSVGFFKLS